MRCADNDWQGLMKNGVFKYIYNKAKKKSVFFLR